MSEVFLKLHIEELDEGGYVATGPMLPGCAAHGDTYDDALKNIKDAIQLWIDTANEFGDPVPVPKGQRVRVA